MPLTDAQRRQLNQQCNRLPIAKLIEYVTKGLVVFPDDLPELSPERKQAIQDAMNNMPNPAEQAEWAAIVPRLQEKSDAVLLMLNNYIANWGTTLPTGNHVADAQTAIDQINKEKQQAMAEQEQAEWEHLDENDIQALTAHLTKYPWTSHKMEIDNYVWLQVTQSPNVLEMVGLYLRHFPSGIHAAEANDIKTNYGEWEQLDKQGTIEEVFGYIKDHPDSGFIDLANQKLKTLKTEEVARMQEMQSNYPIDDLFYYISQGIFTEDELVEEGVATQESLQILRKLDDVKDSLPDINEEIRKCRKECAEGHTDVFLFGIPSTGKTCILMGLIGSSSININTVRAGGPYSCALQQYLEAGFTIGQTPKDFVATIEAEIPDGKHKHKLNLVEMAGEDFAFKIADNENGQVSFEDIGAGATDLLCNNNKKVFFIIVDPTARVVAFNHLVDETDEQGNVRTYLVRKNVNQKIILKRLVDLLAQPENKHILKNVDSINIVVTKADMLGDGQEREKKAYECFIQQHRNIVGPLTELCQENGINIATNGVPMLYTFSLGRFYVGGIYQYDETDANKLVEVLRGNTEVTKKETFWGKVRNTLN